MSESNPGLTILVCALCGSLGWGLRGVFGGQSGAMVPGALMGLGIAAAVARFGLGVDAPRLAAVGAAAFSIGGVTTYGQTLGLVHNSPRPATYWWGVLGCFIKGGLWFGIGTACFGLYLNGHFARPVGVSMLALAAGIAGIIGRRLINEPLDPPHRYPRIYFSRRALEGEDLAKDPPRRESWGGLLFGLLTLCIGAWIGLGDGYVALMGLVGFCGGAVGFSVGEMIQAKGIWGPDGPRRNCPWMDWWKVMEMTFGLIGGAAVGAAVLMAHSTWWHVVVRPASPAPDALPWALAALWLAPLLAAVNGNRAAGKLYDLPMFSGMVIFAACALPGPSALLLAGGFVFYVSGLSCLHRWRKSVSRRVTLPWHLVLVVLTGVSLAFMGLISEPWKLVLWVGLSQTVISFVKALGEREAGGLRERLGSLGAGWPVHASFLVLTAAACILASLLQGGA